MACRCGSGDCRTQERSSPLVPAPRSSRQSPSGCLRQSPENAVTYGACGCSPSSRQSPEPHPPLPPFFHGCGQIFMQDFNIMIGETINCNFTSLNDLLMRYYIGRD